MAEIGPWIKQGVSLGPLLVAPVLFLKGGYRNGFAILLISALLCLGTLVVARLRFPHPQELEHKTAQPRHSRGFSHVYWLYVAAGALFAAGFADFSLIAFHFFPFVSRPLLALCPRRLVGWAKSPYLHSS